MKILIADDVSAKQDVQNYYYSILDDYFLVVGKIDVCWDFKGFKYAVSTISKTNMKSLNKSYIYKDYKNQ